MLQESIGGSVLTMKSYILVQLLRIHLYCIQGGTKGLNTALSLSNAISSLSVTVFGELWKLEPLPEERKSK
ncbi:hypothetical protein Ahy_A03g013124 isoform E [Arachis hypogaea]|uniref:PRONE domain-containing protein n=1 Tax=Arachis hypogaea TaxID=3818 RepID=A0A445DUU2_ARAHY|nr:hypothetical protein Ahy_A03g013124 isoform E [Arachis hypogaea]